MSESELIDIFERTFRLNISGCRRECHCGRQFYNGSGQWDWEEGELERLEKAGATAVDYAIGIVRFEGLEYADACNCWHPRALKLIGFITSHDEQIAKFLNARRERIVAQANVVPPVTP